jgi:hypothetical protein
MAGSSTNQKSFQNLFSGQSIRPPRSCLPSLRIAVLLLIWILLAPRTSYGLQPQLTPAGVAGAQVDDLTLSEYAPRGGLEQTVELHASRIHEDFQHWGFFRIGALPLLVVEDVRITVTSEQYLANAFADVDDWRPPTGDFRHLELRQLAIMVRGDDQPRLRAATAKIRPDGTVGLRTVAVRGPGGWRPGIASATLQIAGPDAGRLSWKADGQDREFSLFQTGTK